MGLVDTVKELRLEARKLGNKENAQFYTTVLGEFQRSTKVITNEKAEEIVKSMAKRIDKFFIELREEGATLGLEEEKILNKNRQMLLDLLPPQLDETVVARLYEETNPAKIGQFMGTINKYCKQNGLTADNKLASEYFKSKQG